MPPFCPSHYRPDPGERVTAGKKRIAPEMGKKIGWDGCVSLRAWQELEKRERRGGNLIPKRCWVLQ